jgi:hypothetical protein
MNSDIQAGTVLVEEGSGLIGFFGLETDPYSSSWSVIKTLDAFALDRKIHAAGWNFFFIAVEVKTTFFGAIRSGSIGKALLRVLKKVGKQDFNCLEVTSIVAKRFLGLPYATVSAHSRHIQQGFLLEDAAQRRVAQKTAKWAGS